MALIDKKRYTYRDLTIVPGIVSTIDHREECNPFYYGGMLPLFTAPMNTVIDENNFEKFELYSINGILPRTVKLDIRVNYSLEDKWSAYSLLEFENIFCNEKKLLESEKNIKALIDVANGHMRKIFTLVKKAKEIYGNKIIIMVGNIANPETYERYAEIGVDYIRCGIGAGCGCLSTSNTGVHYPMASLIDEIRKVKDKLSKEEITLNEIAKKKKYVKLPYIVADGGIRNYSDIIKALALGADFVMVGSVFSKMLESAAEKQCDAYKKFDFTKGNFTCDKFFRWRVDYDNEGLTLGEIKAVFYGMASREGQIALTGKKTKTSEGISKVLRVEYTMYTWVENFVDYLRSAMSYTGSKNLEEFKRFTNLVVNSENAISVVNA